MPIQDTIAVPYFVMSDYLHGNPTNRISSMAAHYDKVWIISITNPFTSTSTNNLPPLVQDGKDRIALQFHDVEADYQDYDPDAIPFNKAMANKVVDFLRKANQENSNDLLVVNCHMGISRSGAISFFARSVFGIDYSTWKRMNPQVIPNGLVLELLHHAWEKYSEKV
jgi:predicted protein tyrosine phosphatase